MAKFAKVSKRRQLAARASSVISRPGSRAGYWYATCAVHGHAPFNSVVEGCELCAAARIVAEDAKAALLSGQKA